MSRYVDGLKADLAAKQRWSIAWKKAAKLQRALAEHWFKFWLRAMLQLDYRVKELAEQRGRYDKLLAEHEALQELLYTLDKEKEE